MPTWKDVLKETKHSKTFQTLLDQLNAHYKEKTVYPPKDKLFEALKKTPYEKTKVVILGQDPYHQPKQANGLAFSVFKDVNMPPSLKNIFKELHADLGVPIPRHGDLTKWAEEGVLLLNTTMSVEASKPGSHKDLGWQFFTDAIIEGLNHHPYPLVFILWGNHAKSKKKLIDEKRHLIIESSHPSPLGAHVSFFGSKPFSKANHFLKKQGRKPIDFSL